MGVKDMATSTVELEIREGSAAAGLEKALEALEHAKGDLALDFSALRRMDAAALRVLEQLASKAQEHSVKVVLRGVNVDVYKVLKLAKLAARFSFS